ncbi:hypothetical protein HGO37_26125 [Rhizobium sp. CG4]|uniref:hypothetical protein n=1 Tax=Rhizobium sp. CG4 TaxID=2726075 RepID=UPI0020334B00|nr:hypothetical protein [Rhizobium sp. CG4]MCM2458862.1 hypothetical protein [Rhizobium sp. CG4]
MLRFFIAFLTSTLLASQTTLAASIMDASGWAFRKNGDQCDLTWSTPKQPMSISFLFDQGSYRLQSTYRRLLAPEAGDIQLSLEGIDLKQNFETQRETDGSVTASLPPGIAYDIVAAMSDGSAGRGEVRIKGQAIAAWDLDDAKSAATMMQDCYFAYISELERSEEEDAGEGYAGSIGDDEPIEFLKKFRAELFNLPEDVGLVRNELSMGYAAYMIAEHCLHSGIAVQEKEFLDLKKTVQKVIEKNNISREMADYVWKGVSLGMEFDGGTISSRDCSAVIPTYKLLLKKYLVLSETRSINPFTSE